jgi:hypothetical protein
MSRSERKPVRPTFRDAKSAALHRALQAAGTIYPLEVLRGGFREGNMSLRALEALDSLQLETGSAEATTGEISRRISELYPSHRRGDWEDIESLINGGRLVRALNNLVDKGFLIRRVSLGVATGRSSSRPTYFSRPVEQQLIAATMH